MAKAKTRPFKQITADLSARRRAATDYDAELSHRITNELFDEGTDEGPDEPLDWITPDDGRDLVDRNDDVVVVTSERMLAALAADSATRVRLRGLRTLTRLGLMDLVRVLKPGGTVTFRRK